ncbi:MAG: hypothetical protein ABI208_10225 [Ginsengibacter sp.]|jgi:Ca2+-dependent lipid-binding protein
MIDIIALIFITREMGKLAAQKGLKPMTWKIYSIVGWIFFEIMGFIVGFMFFDMGNLFSVFIVGLMFAFTSYLIIKRQLSSLPDKNDEESGPIN